MNGPVLRSVWRAEKSLPTILVTITRYCGKKKGGRISVELREYLMELGMQGFECSQILMMLALETDGCENPDLIRAMSGLTGGMGHCQKECGALTGGCCVLGYFAGKRQHGRDRAQSVSKNRARLCKLVSGRIRNPGWRHRLPLHTGS